MSVGDFLGGFYDEDGVTIHVKTISAVDPDIDISTIRVEMLSPSDEGYIEKKALLDAFLDDG